MNFPAIMFIIFILTTLLIISLIVSMDSLEPLEYGITYNKLTKTISKDVFSSGRYLIGPWNSYIRYPSNLVTIEFSDSRRATVNTYLIKADPLQTRTAEGLNLSLHISFQYKLSKNEIPKLYNMANINYQSTYVRISRDVILKVAGQYNATNYWTDRKKIGEFMQSALNKELNSAFAS